MWSATMGREESPALRDGGRVPYLAPGRKKKTKLHVCLILLVPSPEIWGICQE